MKIRNGFVSNSSSSSFIVGIAKINDLNKLKENLLDNNITLDTYQTTIRSLIDIKNDGVFETIYNTNNIEVESFVTSAIITHDKLEDNDFLFIVNISNDEGDSAFYSGGYGNFDYDIDVDYFNEEQQAIYNLFFDEDSGLDLVKKDIKYGAARN